MKIFRINSTSSFIESGLNLAIGNFDGVHIGHQAVIKKLVQESKKINSHSAILSFMPHPRQYFTNNYDDFNIIDENEKIDLFKNLKIDYYISLKFDSILASLSPEKFIQDILVNKLKVNNITVGYDFKFGKDRKGNTDLLKKMASKYNFKVSIINQIKSKKDDSVYSSSLIRKKIEDGDFKGVSLMLGRNWSIKGKVVHGDKRASKINFPTANIIPTKLIKPKKGVYAIKARYLNNFYNGIANFGIRPTIEGKKLLLEAHLFEFNQNIYSKDLTVEFLTFIREEKKFNDFASLSKQIQKDIQIVKKYHLEK